MPVRRTLFLLLCLLVAGCAPAQYVYSTDPVDHRGEALPLARATGLEFEDGSRLRLRPGGSVTLADGRFVTAQGTWDSRQVEALLWTDPAGRPERTPIRTPDDLLDEEDVPRITRIGLQDGEWIDLDALPRATTRFAPNELALEVTADGMDRSLPLAEIHTIELHEPSLLDSTVKDWRFWAVAGAAAVLTVFVTGQTDEDTVAVE